MGRFEGFIISDTLGDYSLVTQNSLDCLVHGLLHYGSPRASSLSNIAPATLLQSSFKHLPGINVGYGKEVLLNPKDKK